jgi:hypothetical protein
MPCFKNLATLEKEIRDRISCKNIGSYNQKNELHNLIEHIVSASLNNTSTKLYD